MDLPRQIVYEPLYHEPIWYPSSKEGLKTGDFQIVYFGNTGLRLDARRNTEGYVEWQLHFMPDNLTERNRDPEKRRQYALVYQFALAKFVVWYQNHSNFNENFPRRSITLGYTNASFHNFKVRLLNTGSQPITLPNIFFDTGNPDSKYEVVNRLDILANSYARESHLEPWASILRNISNIEECGILQQRLI